MKPSISRLSQSTPASRAGSTTIVNMLLTTPPMRWLPGWMLGPPVSAVASSSVTTASA